VGRRAEEAVQRFVVRFLQRRFISQQPFTHSPRRSERLNGSVVVVVTPLIDDAPSLEHSFFTVTNNFSLAGTAFVVNRPLEVEDVLIGFRLPDDAEMTYLRSKICHQTEIGGGFRQVGVQFVDLFDASPYPELRAVEP
jgi:hypothetical protein